MMHGPEKIPVNAFSFFTLVRDTLDSRHESIKLGKILEDADGESNPIFEVLDKVGKSGEPLDSGDKIKLEEEADKHHNED